VAVNIFGILNQSPVRSVGVGLMKGAILNIKIWQIYYADNMMQSVLANIDWAQLVSYSLATVSINNICT